MDSRASEEVLQIMIVVDVEAAECWRLFSVLKFAAAQSVLAAGARLQAQPTVSP